MNAVILIAAVKFINLYRLNRGYTDFSDLFDF